MIKETTEKMEANKTNVNQEKPVETKEKVRVIEVLMEIFFRLYYYRLVLKEWDKGTFYSLERANIIETLDHKKGIARPDKMFTLPTDENTLKAIIAGLQKIPTKPSKKQT